MSKGYHHKFFSGFLRKGTIIPWAGWIRRAFEDAGIDPELIPTKQKEKLVLRLSRDITYLVDGQKKRTYIKLLAEELRKYFP